MRSGLENAVAVYSLSAVSPGRPQSQAGPVATRGVDAGARSTRIAGGAGQREEHQRDPDGRDGAACAVPAGKRNAVRRPATELMRHAQRLLRDGVEHRKKPGGAQAQHDACRGQKRHADRIARRGFLRGAPPLRFAASARKGMPKAFTKQAAASAAVSASSEPAMGNINAREAVRWCRSRPAAPGT